jgi:serine/threonine protein kinase
VRRPNRVVQIGDYRLGSLIDEGPGWQDRKAMHTSVNLERRVRQYMFTKQKTDEARNLVRRAARREFETSELIRHPNVQRALEFREHENGPALLFEHDPSALRLDHYVAQTTPKIERKLHVVRQIAEVLAYAHSRIVLHLALSPRCVLVHEPKSARPTISVMNWQTALRTESTTSGATGTIHVRALVEDDSSCTWRPRRSSSPTTWTSTPTSSRWAPSRTSASPASRPPPTS